MNWSDSLLLAWVFEGCPEDLWSPCYTHDRADLLLFSFRDCSRSPPLYSSVVREESSRIDRSHIVPAVVSASPRIVVVWVRSAYRDTICGTALWFCLYSEVRDVVLLPCFVLGFSLSTASYFPLFSPYYSGSKFDEFLSSSLSLCTISTILSIFSRLSLAIVTHSYCLHSFAIVANRWATSCGSCVMSKR
jgi:hypothetical protein